MKRLLSLFALSLFALPLLLAVGGCTHVLSREALQSVDKGVDFAAVKTEPEAHQGQTLLLGGLIVEATSNREGTRLEVVRYLLDRWGEPRRVDPRGGRFIAVTDQFLDPELYQPGFFVTLTGSVAGVESKDLHGVLYRYPVFKIGEIRLWWRESAGYGYGYGGAYFYNPYYFGTYYDPWWPYRPYFQDRPYWWYDPFRPRHTPPRHRER